MFVGTRVHATLIFFCRARQESLLDVMSGQKNVVGIEGAICSAPVKTLDKRKYTGVWTKGHAGQAKSWVINGSPTQEKLHSSRWVHNKDCQLCGEEGAGLHRLYPCKCWWKVRTEMEVEGRTYERIAVTQTTSIGYGKEDCVPFPFESCENRKNDETSPLLIF